MWEYRKKSRLQILAEAEATKPIIQDTVSQRP